MIYTVNKRQRRVLEKERHIKQKPSGNSPGALPSEVSALSQSKYPTVETVPPSLEPLCC